MVEKVLQINREKTTFWALFGVLVLAIAFYMYCVNSTVHNTVARQDLEQEASKLSLNIGSEEFRYITKKNSVTIAMAKSLGYHETSPSQFIPRNPDTKVAFLSH